MPSLYHHEQLTSKYVSLDDDTLVAYAVELQKMREETEIPRQLGVISLILERLYFEVGQRMKEQPDVVE